MMLFLASASNPIAYASQVDKKVVLEHYELALLTMDEIVDGGVILETEPEVVASRVTMRGADAEGVPMAEQTVSQVGR
jgi:hypothetical protein